MGLYDRAAALEILVDNLLNKKTIISENDIHIKKFACTAKILCLLNSLTDISGY